MADRPTLKAGADTGAPKAVAAGRRPRFSPPWRADNER